MVYIREPTVQIWNEQKSQPFYTIITFEMNTQLFVYVLPIRNTLKTKGTYSYIYIHCVRLKSNNIHLILHVEFTNNSHTCNNAYILYYCVHYVFVHHRSQKSNFSSPKSLSGLNKIDILVRTRVMCLVYC